MPAPRKASDLPSVEYLNECFDLEADTGILRWKARPLHHFVDEHAQNVTNSRQAGLPAGSDNGDGYLTIRILGRMHRAHRVVWAIHTGAWPTGLLDHRDGDRKNNRPGNLREATVGQNNLNSRPRRDNAIGFKGVYRTKSGTYRAAVTMNKKRRNLGTYPTPEEASEVYELAASMLHGEFAKQAA